MKACKHLDYSEERYGESCVLRTLDGFSCPVKYWERSDAFVRTPDGQPDNPRNVQFCAQGRGRINGIFQCYNPGEMSCFDGEDE